MPFIVPLDTGDGCTPALSFDPASITSEDIVAVVGYLRLGPRGDQMCLVAVIDSSEGFASMRRGGPHLQHGSPRLAIKTLEEAPQTRIHVSIALLFLALFAAVTLETLVAWFILAYDLYPSIAFYAAQTDLPDFPHIIDSARTYAKCCLRFRLRQTLLAMIEGLEQLLNAVGGEEADGPSGGSN